MLVMEIPDFNTHLNDTKFRKYSIVHSPTEIRILLTGSIAILAILSVLANALLCIIIYRRPAMRSGINLMLANLATCDVLTCAIAIPISLTMYNLRYWPLNKAACNISGVIVNAVSVEKVSMLLIISFDRYFIIVKRKDILTPEISQRIILVSWFVATAICSPPCYGWSKFAYRQGYTHCTQDFYENSSAADVSYVIFLSVIAVFTPCLLLVYVYCRVLHKVRRRHLQVANHPPIIPTAMHMKGRMYIDINYKTRTTATILVLSLMFAISALPVTIIRISVATNEVRYFRSYSYFVWLSYAHALLSSLVYYLRIRKFRHGVQELLPCYLIWISSVFKLKRRKRISPQLRYQVHESDITIFRTANSEIT